MSDNEGPNEWIGTAFFGIGLAGLGLFVGLAAASLGMGAAAIPVWAMAIGGGALVSRSPIARAFAERIRDSKDDASAPEAIYGELDELRARLLELEERQDFSERALVERTQVSETE